MKLAFSTLPCMEDTAEQLKDLCDCYGFTGAEVRILSDGSFQHGAGLCITNIGSGICIREYDGALLQEAKALFREAEAKKIRAVRVFLGNFRAKYSVPAKHVDHSGIVRMLQELCDSTDIEVWVETHNEYATGKALAELLAEVERPNCKIIWDIIHPIEDGESPAQTLAYLGANIAHVHMKDGRKRKDPEWHDYEYTALGEGELPIGEIVSLLEKTGYEGCYSLEWESAWRPELRALGWSVEEILDKYVKMMRRLCNEDNFISR